jgi:hypothetical protein
MRRGLRRTLRRGRLRVGRRRRRLSGTSASDDHFSKQ